MVQPAGDGVPLLYASILLLILTWLTVIPRAVVRIWKNTLGWDDWLMFVGLLLFTVTSSLCIVCCFNGAGQLAASLASSEKMRGIKLFFIAEFFYASGTAVIKCSIAVTLLRIAGSRRRFKWAIWAIMSATAISAVIFIIGIANICHPITTLWDESTTGTCNLELNSNVSLFFSAVEILTDWALAILPAAMLWNIQMKNKVKFSVAIILGLGAFASCATIIRLRYLSLYSDPAEFMYGTGKIGLWSIIEEGIGIIAGSLHALRPLISLPWMGSNATGNVNGSTSVNMFNQSWSGHQELRTDIKMDTFRQLGDTDGDGDSSKHVLKETQVSMLSNEETGAAVPRKWDRSHVQAWK